MDLNTISLNEQVQLILDVANQLRGPFKEDEYQNVIIPMTILRRFECILEPTKKEVLEEIKKNGKNEKVLRKITKLSIYNTSKFNLTNLQDDATKLAKNLKDYLNHFNDVAKSIFVQLKFYETIDELDKNHKLFVVVKKFSNTDLSNEHVNSMQMGYIMEEIIRTYSENASAGDHFTPKEVIRCLTQLLLSEGCDDLYQDGKIVTLADFACGTGGMLSEGYRMIKDLNNSTMISLYGQDNNGWYEAIALAEMIIKGQNPDNIKLVTSTLTEDAFENQKMRLILMNPPFGLSYSKDKIGTEEYKKIVSHNKRNDWYEAGLPQVGDSQTLFWQFAINKLDDTKGRAAIICNASPLFSDSESEIRKWFLENDYIESIIQFCPELFYNTGISIYAIIFNKNKPLKRKNKIQIIDASNISTRLNKGLGFKRNKISEESSNNQIAEIVKLYSDFKENDRCRILTKEDFYYKKINVQRPLQRRFYISEESIKNVISNASYIKLCPLDEYEEITAAKEKTANQVLRLNNLKNGKILQESIIEKLNKNKTNQVFYDKEEFTKHLLTIIPELKQKEYKTLLKNIVLALSEFDEKGKTYTNKKGKFENDPDFKDVELIPYKKDINEYYVDEVKPYITNAWFEYNPDDLEIVCKINFNTFFYKYNSPEPSKEILERLMMLKKEEQKLEDEIYGNK